MLVHLNEYVHNFDDGGFDYVGWAMWSPREILLYDYRPMLGERWLYDRLSRIQVRVVYAKHDIVFGRAEISARPNPASRLFWQCIS
jgi:hypothetical protein